jgi:hypothetical protein
LHILFQWLGSSSSHCIWCFLVSIHKHNTFRSGKEGKLNGDIRCYDGACVYGNKNPLFHCIIGHLLCLTMLAHFYAIEWEFIAHFLLQITPSEYILEVTLASKAIKSDFTVDGFSEIFCNAKRWCEYYYLQMRLPWIFIKIATGRLDLWDKNCPTHTHIHKHKLIIRVKPPSFLTNNLNAA